MEGAVVSDYRLDNRGLIPGKAKDFFSSLCVHIISEVHPDWYQLGTRVLSPDVKCGRGVKLTTHPM
jgi:hypothetical protein